MYPKLCSLLFFFFFSLVLLLKEKSIFVCELNRCDVNKKNRDNFMQIIINDMIDKTRGTPLFLRRSSLTPFLLGVVTDKDEINDGQNRGFRFGLFACKVWTPVCRIVFYLSFLDLFQSLNPILTGFGYILKILPKISIFMVTDHK